MNYEKGKWYWDGFYQQIVRFKEEYKIGRHGGIKFTEYYTLNGRRHSFDITLVNHVEGLATPAQIEQCLKAYAEKNGYIGSKVKLICGGVGNISEEIKYLEERYGDIVGRNGCNAYTIYHQVKANGLR
jgi:hypothetical protein